MAETRISSVDTTGMDAKDQTDETATDFRRSIATAEQDSPGTRYYPDWSKWFGYYKNVPMLQAVVNKKAVWTLGKGYEADKKTKEVLSRIKGFGKDTFNDIMFNCVVAYTVGGDSFCEVVRDSSGRLKNLKPMNPGSMVIESTEYGTIKRYGQSVVPMKDGKRGDPYFMWFNPKDVFHLPWNRLGDEPHGRSTIEKLQDIIDSMNEAQKDLRIVFHRYVKPLIISQVDTDDTTEIAAFKTKLDNAVENMENLIVPSGTVDMERMSIPQYSTLDPLPWIQALQNYFVMAEGVPEVILGFGRETTEASSKILYLAFQQTVEHNQRFIEAQLKSQLKLDVQFNFPENIAPEVDKDNRKARKMSNMEMKGMKAHDRGTVGTRTNNSAKA